MFLFECSRAMSASRSTSEMGKVFEKTSKVDRQRKKVEQRFYSVTIGILTLTLRGRNVLML
jgi:hypothetical protein